MTETIAHTAVEVPEGTTSPELEAYSAAMQVAQDFREANSLVLDTWQLMQAEIQRLEDALKVAARQTGAVENESYRVIVTFRNKTWFDTGLILEKCPFVRTIPGVIIETVDEKKIAQLAKGGMVPAEVVQEATKTEAMTAAVTIKRKTKPEPAA